MLRPYERLGQFYLSKRYGLGRAEHTPDLVSTGVGKAGLARMAPGWRPHRRLRDAAEVQIYTAGSRAATPLPVLARLGPRLEGDPEQASMQATNVAARTRIERRRAPGRLGMEAY